MPALVAVRSLVKSYGSVEAVQSLDFTIEKGEIFGLLGPNGAGKTTALECLIGLREPDEGELAVCGLDARRQLPAVKEKIGVALQTTALQDKITPREALTLFSSFYEQRTAPQTLLERFALTEKADARFETLSGGQRQRLALALAFVNRPELVLLDEPTNGLDPQSRNELHADIIRMKQDGHTILLTTHYLEEAEQLCDRVAIMDRGRLVASGTPRDLIAQSNAIPAATLVTARPMARPVLAGMPGVQDSVCEGTTARFRTETPTETIAALAALLVGEGNAIIEFHLRKASLEEVFLGLTKGMDRNHIEETGVAP